MLVKWQVVGLAIFFALILRPVAVDEDEEVEDLLDGKNQSMQPNIFFDALIYQGWQILL